jgi:hypothetical protein
MPRPRHKCNDAGSADVAPAADATDPPSDTRPGHPPLQSPHQAIHPGPAQQSTHRAAHSQRRRSGWSRQPPQTRAWRPRLPPPRPSARPPRPAPPPRRRAPRPQATTSPRPAGRQTATLSRPPRLRPRPTQVTAAHPQQREREMRRLLQPTAPPQPPPQVRVARQGGTAPRPPAPPLPLRRRHPARPGTAAPPPLLLLPTQLPLNRKRWEDQARRRRLPRVQRWAVVAMPGWRRLPRWQGPPQQRCHCQTGPHRPHRGPRQRPPPRHRNQPPRPLPQQVRMQLPPARSPLAAQAPAQRRHPPHGRACCAPCAPGRQLQGRLLLRVTGLAAAGLGRRSPWRRIRAPWRQAPERQHQVPAPCRQACCCCWAGWWWAA